MKQCLFINWRDIAIFALIIVSAVAIGINIVNAQVAGELPEDDMWSINNYYVDSRTGDRTSNHLFFNNPEGQVFYIERVEARETLRREATQKEIDRYNRSRLENIREITVTDAKDNIESCATDMQELIATSARIQECLGYLLAIQASSERRR